MLKLHAERAPKARPRFDLSRILFGPQLAFATDEAQYADGLCSRRAGKSVGVGAWLLDGPLENPSAPSLYITLTRGSGKRIIWPTLLDLNRKYALGFEPNEADLVLKRNGRGAVYLIGADNRSEIEKARGVGWGRVAIDEAQAFPAYLKELVEDVLDPALMDHGGKLRLIGTPGPVPVGFFFGCTQNPRWKHHHWTAFENPHVRAREHLAKTLEMRGVTEDDPGIQREFFGRWAHDANSLVFRYRPELHFDALPLARRPWRYVLGIDLGYEDADAIAVVAFNEEHPAAYLVEEYVDRKQGITALTEKVAALVERLDPVSIVWDTGGLGKKVASEVTQRTGVPLKAAEKDRKFEFIELLNDAMRTSRLKAKKDSRFASDSMLVEWDRDKSRPDRLVISDRFHSDICDAVLYAFRESLHWLHVPEESPGPVQGSPEHFAAQEREYFERLEAEQEAKREDELLETNGGWGWE